MAEKKPFLNIVPFQRPDGSATSKAHTSPESRLEDDLPDDAPDFMAEYRTAKYGDIEKRIFKWLRQHGMQKGVHSTVDSVIVAKLAKALAKSLRLEKFLEENDDYYEIEDMIGNTKYVLRPQVHTLAGLNHDINNYMRMLLFHPGARKTLVPKNRRVTADVNRWGT